MMNLRQWKKTLLFLLALCLMGTWLLPVPAQAATEEISIIGLYDRTDASCIGLRVRVVDAIGNGISSSAQQFTAAVDDVPVEVLDGFEGLSLNQTGYIFVVDVSRYFLDFPDRIPGVLTTLLSELTSIMQEEDGARFIWVTDIPETTAYMSRSSASSMFNSSDMISGLYRGSNGKSALYDAIFRGVQLATTPESDDPYIFHQVVVISDGFNDAGNTGSSSLNAALEQIAQTVHTPIWAVAMCNSGASGNLSSSSASNQSILQNFVASTGGSYCTLDYNAPVLNKSGSSAKEQSRQIRAKFSQQQAGNVNLLLNLSHALDKFDRTPNRTVKITVTHNGVSASCDSKLDLSRLPQPPVVETPTPEITPVPPFACFGDQDSENVRALQQKLIELGYFHGSADGNFGNSTRLAFQQMCQANDIEVVVDENGTIVISQEMYNQIAKDPYLITPTPRPTTPAPTSTPTPSPTPVPPYASFGDRDSDHVRNLQQLLADLGYYEGEIDGNFGMSTRQAYRALCEANDLSFDADEQGNIVIAQERFTLISTDTSLATATPVPTTPPPTPTPTPSPTPVPPYASFGDRDSDHVRNLQQLLADLGYYEGDIDGNFGNSTRQAYTAMCEANDLPVTTDASGMLFVAPEVFARISGDMSLTTNPPPTATPVPEIIDLAFGDQDQNGTTYVSNLQNHLKALNYYNGHAFTPGVYDEATVEALALFCQTNGLNSALDGTTASANLQEQFLFSATQPYVAPAVPLPQRIRATLSRSISIGSLNISIWIIIVVCAVLLLIILLLIILIVLRSHRSDPELDPPSDSLPPVTPVHNQSAVGNDLPTVGQTPPSDDEKTVSVFSAAPQQHTVTLEITYNGATKKQTETVNGRLTIGRKDCQVRIDPSDTTASRRHCELFFDGSQLKVRNLSSSATGTLLNGRNIAASSTPSFGEDSPTVSFDSSYPASTGGEATVVSGDVLTVGRHQIKVTY